MRKRNRGSDKKPEAATRIACKSLRRFGRSLRSITTGFPVFLHVFAMHAVALTLSVSLSAEEGARPLTTKKKIFSADDSFLTFTQENTERINFGGKTQIRLVRRPDGAPHRDDLALDFEHESLFSNPADGSLVQKADFEREVHNGMNGKTAHFSLASHGLKIRLPSYLHLSGSGLTREAGDFSFAAEIELNSQNGEILRRENFANGKQFLFSIALRTGRVIVKLENLLELHGTAENRKALNDSTELIAVDKIKTGRRHLIILTYREAEGKLTLTINGREQATKVLKRASDENYFLTFSPLRTAPLVLFSPFRGYADNILFTNRVLNEDDIAHFGALKPDGDRYQVRRGVLYSDLFDMGYSESSVVALQAETETTEENHLAVSARCLNRRFKQTLGARDLKFEKITAFKNKKCRFIQFKAELTADNSGEKSPALENITIEYRENPPPDRPLKPKILSAKNETLELEIIPNTELDVVKGGRYIIYYGHKAHEPQGAIYFTSSTRDVIAHKVPIRVRISYDTIAANKSWADKHPRFKYGYPVFETGIGFYFWVTACDNAYGEAQELADHESLPSPAVFARFE